jgi:hypothetical protein
MGLSLLTVYYAANKLGIANKPKTKIPTLLKLKFWREMKVQDRQ